MRNILKKNVIETIEKIIFKNVFSESGFFYEIMRKNIAETDKSQVTLCHLHIVFWINKSKDTF